MNNLDSDKFGSVASFLAMRLEVQTGEIKQNRSFNREVAGSDLYHKVWVILGFFLGGHIAIKLKGRIEVQLTGADVHIILGIILFCFISFKGIPFGYIHVTN